MNGTGGLTAPEGPYTRIGNQLLEALPLVKLNRTQENICIFLWRRTYGWNRTRDAISLTDFAAACGNCKEWVSKQINTLMRKRIIRRIYVPGRASIYSFVADVTEWEEGCIDIEALERNRRSNTYRCAPGEMPDPDPCPGALWPEQTGEEYDDPCEDPAEAGGEMYCPLMEKGWLTHGIDDDRENEIHPARLRPADIKEPGAANRSGRESNSCTDQELNPGTTQELNSTTTQELNPGTTQELNSTTTQELNPGTTQELNSTTTQELNCRTTPEQGPAPLNPGLGPPLNTDLKTILKTDRKTVLKTERNRKEFTPGMPQYQLAALLLERIKHNIPHFKEPNMQDWSSGMDLILRVDKKDMDLVREVIRFSQADDFWLTIIHNPKKLRKHFYQLDMQRRRQRSGPGAPGNPVGRDDWDMEKEEYEHFFD